MPRPASLARKYPAVPIFRRVAARLRNGSTPEEISRDVTDLMRSMSLDDDSAPDTSTDRGDALPFRVKL